MSLNSKRAAEVIVLLLRAGESVRFRAHGNSMWPAIPSRSFVEVQPCPVSELAVGDIAAFERDGRVVVHRIRGIASQGVVFAGDALRKGDGCVDLQRVLGRARVIRRRPLTWRWPTPRHLRLLCRAAYWRLLSRRPQSV